MSEVAPEWTETKVAEPGDRGWVSVSCPARSEADTRPQGEEGTVILLIVQLILIICLGS